MRNESKDEYERRCPRLGGPVSFKYCRLFAQEKSPCFKIIECWWEFFDVYNHLKEDLPEEDFNQILIEKPKPKIQSLLELIKQAKQNQFPSPSTGEGQGGGRGSFRAGINDIKEDT
jgi:hypothetical protein